MGYSTRILSALTQFTLAGDAADSDATGIFRLWTNRDRHWMQDVRPWWARVHPLTASAQQKLDAWDQTTDDPAAQCIPAGMPEAMLMPFPIEFIDAGDEIILNIEEWDNSRTIHLAWTNATLIRPPRTWATRSDDGRVTR